MTTQERLERFFQSIRGVLRGHRDTLRGGLEAFTASLRGEIERAREERGKKNLYLAEDFNVFDFLRPDENGLSDVIAWLLDPHGSHGQQATFLRLFLTGLSIPVNQPLESARVYREEATTYLLNPLRRIDILIDFGTFGVGIENKPWALEQPEQVRDYLRELGKKYGEQWALVYLSGDGSAPASVSMTDLMELESRNQFRVAAYPGDFSRWLRACLDGCRAEKVRLFLTDFLAYVRGSFVTQVADWRRATP